MMEHSLYQDWQAFSDLLMHLPEEWRETHEREAVALVKRVRLEAADRLFASPFFKRQWIIDQMLFYINHPNGITIDEGESNEYRCVMCKQVYEKEWTDEKAWEETQGYWPDVNKENCAVICDDCWQKIHPERSKIWQAKQT